MIFAKSFKKDICLRNVCFFYLFEELEAHTWEGNVPPTILHQFPPSKPLKTVKKIDFWSKYGTIFWKKTKNTILEHRQVCAEYRRSQPQTFDKRQYMPIQKYTNTWRCSKIVFFWTWTVFGLNLDTLKGYRDGIFFARILSTRRNFLDHQKGQILWFLMIFAKS